MEWSRAFQQPIDLDSTLSSFGDKDGSRVTLYILEIIVFNVQHMIVHTLHSRTICAIAHWKL